VPTHGTPIPAETLDSVRRNKLALKGPLATPIGDGFRSVTVALRKEFDLYANVRPARSFAGVETRYSGVDLVVIRENTQGLYSGVEHYIDEERTAAESISIITRKGSERIIEYAFDYCKTNKRRRLTLVHKANILKCTSGLFLDTGRAIAAKHPEIEFRDMIVDNAAMQLVKNPNQFDVLVTTNLFGDILSDLTAGHRGEGRGEPHRGDAGGRDAARAHRRADGGGQAGDGHPRGHRVEGSRHARPGRQRDDADVHLCGAEAPQVAVSASPGRSLPAPPRRRRARCALPPRPAAPRSGRRCGTPCAAAAG
jgi:Isocitrate/isopropylmalate dehydrogenase